MAYPQNWDLTSYFPRFNGPEYTGHWSQLESDIQTLKRDVEALGDVRAENAAAWADFYTRIEAFESDFSHLSSYLGCLTSTDTTNEDYRRDSAKLNAFQPVVSQVKSRVERALGSCSDASFEAFLKQPAVSDLRYAFERARQQARYRMDLALEDLRADLDVTGINAWGRLYNSVMGKLKFQLKTSQGEQSVSQSQKVSLLGDPDPEVRKATLTGSNAAIAAQEDTFAAALNAISGSRLTVYKRRGINHFLQPAMWSAGCDLETIETMYAAIRERIEIPRSYLRLKKKVLGLPSLGFQDLDAPLPLKESAQVDWDKGVDLVLSAFKAEYPALHDYAKIAVTKAWIDAKPGANRAPGGYCTGSRKIRESRIYMTYGGSLGDITTLAHELGHAFHSHVMRDIRFTRMKYPMTLAETASTFAQTIVAKAVASDRATPTAMRQQMLTSLLDDGASFCLNIQMRYEFEKRVYERRAKGELSARELKALMEETQKEIYGDTLDPQQLDPYFWASKLHFYITGLSFYNFPYTFGYLLSRAFYGLYRKEGPSFLAKYEAFLRQSGSLSCEDVVQTTIGADIRRKDFWLGALDEIAADLREFEAATKA